MKNIHVLPNHIYITADEEIKEGDWMIRNNEQPTLVTPDFFWDFGGRYNKIILTTNQDLIKNGVQAIDDEFLEWFVKNLSCEKIEVQKFGQRIYKIIIPQEEAKQKTMKTAVEWLVDEIEKVFVNQDIKNTKVFEQAKEMEKQKIIDAYDHHRCIGNFENGEEYYNQTFKQQEKLNSYEIHSNSSYVKTKITFKSK